MNINFGRFFESFFFPSNSNNQNPGHPSTKNKPISSETDSIISALSRGLTPMTPMQEFEQSLIQLLRAYDLIDVFDPAKNSITSEDRELADRTSQDNYSKSLNLLSFILNIADCKFKNERDEKWPALKNPSTDIVNLANDTMKLVAKYDQTEGILLSKSFRDDILTIIEEHHNLFYKTDTEQATNQLAEDILSKAAKQAMKNDLK